LSILIDLALVKVITKLERCYKLVFKKKAFEVYLVLKLIIKNKTIIAGGYNLRRVV
jgi:hypothetical protein